MTIYTKRVDFLDINFPFNKREVCGDDIVIETYNGSGINGAEYIYRITPLNDDSVKTNTVVTETDGNKTIVCGEAIKEQINSYGTENRPWHWVPGKEK